MPRETITGSAVAGSGGFHVQVGWARDQEVQIGVEADEGRSLFWVLTGTGSDVEQDRRTHRLAEIGAVLRAASEESPRGLSGSPDPDVGHLYADSVFATKALNALDTLTHNMMSSVWSDLDRVGCNRLIQIVRKARDAAFGRDE